MVVGGVSFSVILLIYESYSVSNLVFNTLSVVLLCENGYELAAFATTIVSLVKGYGFGFGLRKAKVVVFDVWVRRGGGIGAFGSGLTRSLRLFLLK